MFANVHIIEDLGKVHTVFDLHFYSAFLQRLETRFSKENLLPNLRHSNFSSLLLVIFKAFMFTEAEASVVSKNLTFVGSRFHTVFFKPSKEIKSKI